MADERFARLFPRLQSLSGRLIVFGTLVTLVAVASSIFALSVLIRRQARVHLVELLSQNQANARDLQERSLQELLWISTLLSESPTLRAAMDTYRSESNVHGTHRQDLLATVGAEVRRIRELVGKSVVIVTDEDGIVLATDPALDPALAAGSNLRQRSWMSEVLDATDSAGRPIFGVMEAGGQRLHVGCVPIVLQGYVIGTLALGDRMDDAWLVALAGSLSSDLA